MGSPSEGSRRLARESQLREAEKADPKTSAYNYEIAAHASLQL